MLSMRYNWDGDVICHECAVERKRFIPGLKKPVPTDIREFVSPSDDVVIKRILSELAESKSLPKSKKPGDFDRRAMVIWDYVARSIHYEGDRKRKRSGHSDIWLFPAEVKALGRGDCEDASFLLASLLLGSGISPFNIRVVLGRLVDREGRPIGDHSWPMYKNELGEWCILEATRERAAWSLIKADSLSELEEIRYEPHYCFNNYHLWAIKHEEVQYKDIFSYLKGHSERLVNLESPRFASGGWLSAVTGDNTPGHQELTTRVLQEYGFSDDAITVASDASQDPDFYDWYTAAAHAQTDCDPKTGATTQSAEQGIECYLAWVNARIQAFLKARDMSEALFHLGYLLHGIQDLASHQGVTNAQHAYESDISVGKDHDCDHDEGNRKVAIKYCSALLKKLLPLHPLAKSISSYRAANLLMPAKLSKEKKAIALGKPGWDLSVSAVAEYKGLAKKYEIIRELHPRIKWDRDIVFSKILK